MAEAAAVSHPLFYLYISAVPLCFVLGSWSSYILFLLFSLYSRVRTNSLLLLVRPLIYNCSTASMVTQVQLTLALDGLRRYPVPKASKDPILAYWK